MDVHVGPGYLLLLSTLGHSDLGPLNTLAAFAAVAGLLVTAVSLLRGPVPQFLWLLLPLAVTHAFLQVVAVWRIGDYHEGAALWIYGLALLAALSAAAYGLRMRLLAVVGSSVFSLAYAWYAIVATTFVFWSGLH